MGIDRFPFVVAAGLLLLTSIASPSQQVRRSSQEGGAPETEDGARSDSINWPARLANALESVCDDAAYACEFKIRALELVSGDLEGLQDTPFAHLVPILRESSDSPATPVVTGLAHYAKGAHSFYVKNRIVGQDIVSVAYCDGGRSVELIEGRRATVWTHPTEAGVIGLPWTLTRFGASSLAPILRAAILRETVQVEEGKSGGCRVVFPLPAAGAPPKAPKYRALVSFSATQNPDADRVYEIEIRRGTVLISRCALRDHETVNGALLPTDFTLTTRLPALKSGENWYIAHHGEIKYVEGGPDPSAILQAVAGVAEIRTRGQKLFPVAGLDAAMNAVTAAYPLNPVSARNETEPTYVAPARPTVCAVDDAKWVNIDKWLQSRLDEGTIKTRDQSADTHCLQVACVMVAKWAGRPAKASSVMVRWPQANMVLAGGVDILSGLGLDYVAVEVSRRALANCRQPFVILERRSGRIAHAVAAMVTQNKLYQWRPSHRLISSDIESVKDGKTMALVSKEDHRAMR